MKRKKVLKRNTRTNVKVHVSVIYDLSCGKVLAVNDLEQYLNMSPLCILCPVCCCKSEMNPGSLRAVLPTDRQGLPMSTLIHPSLRDTQETHRVTDVYINPTYMKRQTRDT